MSKIGVRLKLDVTKINKDLLFKGAKGTYLDATMFIDLDEQDQYGNNGMVTQDISQEAKASGERSPIIGNTKVFWRDAGQPSGNTGQLNKPQSEFTATGEEESDIPF